MTDKHDPFDGADYYDCSGCEVLEHGTPSDALLQYLDDCFDPKESVVDCIKRVSPITMKAYRRAAIGPEQIDRWTQYMVEHLDEMIYDEDALCNPESGGDTGVGLDIARDIGAKMRPLVEEYAKHVDIWHCDMDGERSFSAEEVESMMRKLAPHWFVEKARGEP